MVTLIESLQYNKSSCPRDKSNPSDLGMLNVFKQSCLGVTVVKLRLGKGEWEYRKKGTGGIQEVEGERIGIGREMQNTDLCSVLRKCVKCLSSP